MTRFKLSIGTFSDFNWNITTHKYILKEGLTVIGKPYSLYFSLSLFFKMEYALLVVSRAAVGAHIFIQYMMVRLAFPGE